MKGKFVVTVIISLVIAAVFVLIGGFFLTIERKALGQSRSWRVWVRTSPCSGRHDWLSVAQRDPTGGGNYFSSYESLLGNQGCTLPEPNGCTFAQATALREKLRRHSKFIDYCCRDYSVWKNVQTGKMSVVLGKNSTAGFGWSFVKGNLCCEEAEALAGIPGACGGGTAKCGLGHTWNEEESGWRSVWTRRGNSNVFDARFTGPAGQKASTVNTVTIEGNRISIKRTSSSDGYLCTYQGTIQADGVTIIGTYSCGNRKWRATINCGDHATNGSLLIVPSVEATWKPYCS
jgi:hypothetical protein